MKVKYRAYFRKLIGLLPKEARFEYFRKSVNFKFPSERLVFKVASTKRELEEAFRILHDAYVEYGFMKPHPSGMRITIYHALPSTTTLIALWDGNVVGTMSIIRDNFFGFAIDKIYDTKTLRQNGARVGEVSALAIRKDFRGNRGEVLLPFIAFLTQYCMQYFGIDYWVIAVNPNRIDFYESILFFTRLQENKIVENYDFANGAPAVGAYLHLRTFYKNLAVHYGKRPPNSNLFELIMGQPLTNFQFPDRAYFKVSDPVMTPEMLAYFFEEASSVFADLPDRDRAILRAIYTDPAYQERIPAPKDGSQYALPKRAPRFEVSCKGQAIVPGAARFVSLTVIDVSLRGFRAVAEELLRHGEELHFHIAIGNFDIADLKGHVIWKNNKIYGFNVTKASDNWRAFVEHMNSDQHRVGIDMLPIAG